MAATIDKRPWELRMIEESTTANFILLVSLLIILVSLPTPVPVVVWLFVTALVGWVGFTRLRKIRV